MAWEENSRICLHMQLIAILSRTGVAMVFMDFLQLVSDLCPCGRIPQNAALLLARPLMVRQPYSEAV